LIFLDFLIFIFEANFLLDLFCKLGRCLEMTLSLSPALGSSESDLEGSGIVRNASSSLSLTLSPGLLLILPLNVNFCFIRRALLINFN
jgi:hypothetical protein